MERAGASAHFPRGPDAFAMEASLLALIVAKIRIDCFRIVIVTSTARVPVVGDSQHQRLFQSEYKDRLSRYSYATPAGKQLTSGTRPGARGRTDAAPFPPPAIAPMMVPSSAPPDEFSGPPIRPKTLPSLLGNSLGV